MGGNMKTNVLGAIVLVLTGVLSATAQELMAKERELYEATKRESALTW
jgi:hypothetical protein